MLETSYTILASISLVNVMHHRLVNAPFATLSKSFLTAINTANKWLLTSVRKIMFYKVLLQRKMLTALTTNPFLVNFVNLHVPFEAILGFKVFVAGDDITLEFFSWHFCSCNIVYLYFKFIKYEKRTKIINIFQELAIIVSKGKIKFYIISIQICID